MAAKKGKKRGQGSAATRKKRPPPRKGKPRPGPVPAHVTPVPRDSGEVVAWFQGLSVRVVTDEQLRALVEEAHKYDLVGLSEALGNEQDALALNRAANTLLEAAIAASPGEGERAHLLSVLRDILNDS